MPRIRKILDKETLNNTVIQMFKHPSINSWSNRTMSVRGRRLVIRNLRKRGFDIDHLSEDSHLFKKRE